MRPSSRQAVLKRQAPVGGSRNPSVQDILNERFSLNKGARIAYAVASQFYTELDCPTSLGLYLCLKYGDYDSIAKHSVSPAHFNKAEDYFHAKQAVSYLGKFPHPSIRSEVLREKAFATFLQGEEQCIATNWRFRQIERNPLYYGNRFADVLHRARLKICDVLGDVPYQEIVEQARLGPGNSLAVDGTSASDKFGSSEISCTEELLPWAGILLTEYPAWVEAHSYNLERTHYNGWEAATWGEIDCILEKFRVEDGFTAQIALTVVPGEKYGQVPKDAKTNRNIGTQPLLNGWLQLGVGQVMRRRLKKVGVDLDLGQDHNRRLAKIGSERGHLATFDLTNASDTIATRLVSYLLPDDWFRFLDLIRCKRIQIDGKVQALNRFSSMGNGFTFELESLIFWALTSVITEPKSHKEIAVYGDDIIAKGRYSRRIRTYFGWCGFTVNPKKSFSTGPFRESCGADYWAGRDVRPLFLKGVPEYVADLIQMANGLHRVDSSGSNNCRFASRFVRSAAIAVRNIPWKLRKVLAVGYGDDDACLIGEHRRHGRKVVFRVKPLHQNFLPAKAALLFKLQRREAQSAYIAETFLAERLSHIPVVGSMSNPPHQNVNHRRSTREVENRSTCDASVNYRRGEGTYRLVDLTYWDKLQ